MPAAADDSENCNGLWYDDFDPATSPPDGDEAWLAELRDEHLVDPWTGNGEKIAAGFLHHDGGRRGAGFAAGGVLDQLAPGPVLAGFTAEAVAGGLANLGESELVGVLCAMRRMTSWAAAGEAEAVITLARRRAAQARQEKRPGLIDHVSDEVAAALTLTGRAGTRAVDVAAGLERLDPTRAALYAGIIDGPRSVVFADELAALDDAGARKAEAMVLPRAGGMTTGQLRAALRRAVLAVDPEAAVRRRKTAARKDAAVHLWQEPSGNYALAGREIPPAEAIATDRRLTAQARWLQANGAPGTLEYLRSAAFRAGLAGRPLTTLLPAAPGTGTGTGSTAPPGPGAAGSGGSEADAPGSTGSEAGGSDAGDSGPGAPDHGHPDPGPPGPATAGPGGGDPDFTGPGGDPGWQPSITGNVNLTMPVTAWNGTSDAPGEIPGHGTADAGTCRDLATWLAANPATQWCLTLTDHNGHAVAHACAPHGPGPPATQTATKLAAGWLGTLRPAFLETGDCSHARQAAGYRPPRSLRHLITIRQRTCGHPGCGRDAYRCDLDHTRPWHLGGPTCECNLAPLCRRHHQTKQTPRWHLDQTQPGILTWTAPHGRSYTTVPDPYPI
jgi:hypothetical protein